ncbi:hypothetical protein M441DRAFT_446520 [Trichoderma asperellum CBS 433.97]|uniref:Uncharacterized protein n=1 Tax=Trichoderma asperellum (strain ATCC 204424 / CBS 433.97 / NBRC 101777) TaxID=1042311 RepID=A0A2T3Z2N6_TRIA4|nr:hypothetical protein M441DRAFT_446520 [Trichoderma asperellum CBS 433.97]PTB39076.1 hypothetical protein M441DRAFT_446520 [Trichoderma asperellum CBS 433.97]
MAPLPLSMTPCQHRFASHRLTSNIGHCYVTESKPAKIALAGSAHAMHGCFSPLSTADRARYESPCRHPWAPPQGPKRVLSTTALAQRARPSIRDF